MDGPVSVQLGLGVFAKLNWVPSPFVEQRPKNVEQRPKKWNRSCKRISVPQIVTQNKTIIRINNLSDYLLRCDTQSKWYTFCGIVLLFAEL